MGDEQESQHWYWRKRGQSREVKPMTQHELQESLEQTEREAEIERERRKVTGHKGYRADFVADERRYYFKQHADEYQHYKQLEENKEKRKQTKQAKEYIKRTREYHRVKWLEEADKYVAEGAMSAEDVEHVRQNRQEPYYPFNDFPILGGFG